MQLHHGTADESVPLEFSATLQQQIQSSGGTAEFYTYEGDDHNLSKFFSLAMARSIEFFDRYLKADEAAASVLSAEFIAGVPEVRLEAEPGPD